MKKIKKNLPFIVTVLILLLVFSNRYSQGEYKKGAKHQYSIEAIAYQYIKAKIDGKKNAEFMLKVNVGRRRLSRTVEKIKKEGITTSNDTNLIEELLKADETDQD